MTLMKCKICGNRTEITKILGICINCIRDKPELSKPFIKEAHRKSREKFNLPAEPPKEPKGVKCDLCANQCRIPENGKGYCGLRANKEGKIVHLGGTPEKGILEWYYDPIPTNCVAQEFCAASANVGYPKFSYSKGVEYGYKNLAVFYGSCSFNCLFCQNWHHRSLTTNLKLPVSSKELADRVDEKTSCICYFGGDPGPQLPHAIKTSELVREKSEILRICLETNGTMNRKLLKKFAILSLESGGCIKFDLKAWDENLQKALCGVENKLAFKNFEYLAQFEREEPPFLVASTLLIPGYVDVVEVRKIAEFIAELDSDIPYSLLAFYPNFYMSDLPTTSWTQAKECLNAAKDSGLKKVRLGNIHLLR